MGFGSAKSVRTILLGQWEPLAAAILFLQFTTPSYAAEVTLAWDPSPATNVAGYEVHYKKGCRRGPPYDGKGANEGVSPIKIENVNTYKLTDLSDSEGYCFAVKAYVSPKLKSKYSNVVCINCKADVRREEVAEKKPVPIELSVVAPVNEELSEGKNQFPIHFNQAEK